MKNTMILSLCSVLLLMSPTEASATDLLPEQQKGGAKPPHQSSIEATVDDLTDTLENLSLDNVPNLKVVAFKKGPKQVDALKTLFQSTDLKNQNYARKIMQGIGLDTNDPNQVSILIDLWNSPEGAPTLWRCCYNQKGGDRIFARAPMQTIAQNSGHIAQYLILDLFWKSPDTWSTGYTSWSPTTGDQEFARPFIQKIASTPEHPKRDAALVLLASSTDPQDIILVSQDLAIQPTHPGHVKAIVWLIDHTSGDNQELGYTKLFDVANDAKSASQWMAIDKLYAVSEYRPKVMVSIKGIAKTPNHPHHWDAVSLLWGVIDERDFVTQSVEDIAKNKTHPHQTEAIDFLLASNEHALSAARIIVSSAHAHKEYWNSVKKLYASEEKTDKALATAILKKTIGDSTHVNTSEAFYLLWQSSEETTKTIAALAVVDRANHSERQHVLEWLWNIEPHKNVAAVEIVKDVQHPHYKEAIDTLFASLDSTHKRIAAKVVARDKLHPKRDSALETLWKLKGLPDADDRAFAARELALNPTHKYHKEAIKKLLGSWHQEDRTLAAKIVSADTTQKNYDKNHYTLAASILGK
ncbi:MAG: hypothetical protein ACTHJ4_08320 [Candidatus Nucleicultricaceae bacterium]